MGQTGWQFQFTVCLTVGLILPPLATTLVWTSNQGFFWRKTESCWHSRIPRARRTNNYYVSNARFRWNRNTSQILAHNWQWDHLRSRNNMIFLEAPSSRTSNHHRYSRRSINTSDLRAMVLFQSEFLAACGTINKYRRWENAGIIL